MTTAADRRRYSFAEYLEIEELSPAVRHEFVDGEIFAMGGGSIAHSALASAIVGLLFAHVRGGRCHVHGSDLRIRIRQGNVATYADAAVVRDPIERDPESPTHVTNPRVVVEVLSPSTESYDRNAKRLSYQSLPSLEEYVLVAQDARKLEVFRRTSEGFACTVYGAGERAKLGSIGFELDVDELYAAAGVEVA